MIIGVSLCSEHSMADTLTVALRVAEEAIDEAISKAEFDTSSQVIYIVYILLTVCHHAFIVGTILNSEWDAD